MHPKPFSQLVTFFVSFQKCTKPVRYNETENSVHNMEGELPCCALELQSGLYFNKINKYKQQDAFIIEDLGMGLNFWEQEETMIKLSARRKLK